MTLFLLGAQLVSYIKETRYSYRVWSYSTATACCMVQPCMLLNLYYNFCFRLLATTNGSRVFPFTSACSE